MKSLLTVLGMCVVISSYAQPEKPAIDTPAVDIKVLQQAYQRPKAVPYPEDNPYSMAKAQLGKTLFFDPRLSRSGVTSCATCHNPGLHWGDGLAKGRGDHHKELGRRTPPTVNLAWGELYFWDGRADSLEAQALGPILSKDEMNMDMQMLLKRLRRNPEYQKMFSDAFPNTSEPVNAAHIAKALATFQRGLVSLKSPFDRWVDGDSTAISTLAKSGFILFNTKAACSDCHSGWRFTDDSFHDIGLSETDRGRGDILKKLSLMQYAFKTPSLRNVAELAPYMHAGQIESLEAVIEHYNTNFKERSSLSPLIKPLGLTQPEKEALVTFLQTLTSPTIPITMPHLPRNKEN